MLSCIKLMDVSVYVPGREEPVLRNLNLSVRQGEWLAVTGINGCGKSVLAKLLAGLDGRYSGEIRRTGAGTLGRIVLQNPEAQLIGDTVWEDVCYGLEHQEDDSADGIGRAAGEALALAGLRGLEDRAVNSLSGGQKQLLALAGAIAAKAPFLVTDEATSMLDTESRTHVLNLLQKLNRQGITIIMITQLLEELSYADRVLALREGSIVYDGGKERFFYSGTDGEESGCEAAGLAPPYTVRTARELLRLGVSLNGWPITPEELIRAVMPT